MSTGSASGGGGQQPPPDDDPWAAPPPGQPPPPPGQLPQRFPDRPAPYGGDGGPGGGPGQTDGRAAASLALGLLGLLSSLAVVGALPGFLGILLGVSSRRRARISGGRPSPLALTGIITGALALTVAATVMFVAFELFGPQFENYRNCMDTALTVEQQRACQDQLRSQIEQAR